MDSPSLAAQHLPLLSNFWQAQLQNIEHGELDFKNYQLPLARIKKVMKTDEEVKHMMISAEVSCPSSFKRVHLHRPPLFLPRLVKYSFWSLLYARGCTLMNARGELCSGTTWLSPLVARIPLTFSSISFPVRKQSLKNQKYSSVASRFIKSLHISLATQWSPLTETFSIVMLLQILPLPSKLRSLMTPKA